MTLNEAIRLLRQSGVPSPEHDARELFEFFGGYPHGVPLPPDTDCDNRELAAAVRRRAEREPLQYIIGKAYFYRECYEVSPDCLIPRSDTEMLVDYAVKALPKEAKFLDLCTGSGCIAISTLANTRDTLAVAVDVSKSALALAGRNAEKNGVAERLTLIECDLLSDCVEVLSGEFDAVLSNPPYIPRRVYEALDEEIFHEPRGAFVGGEDGAIFYERLIPLSLCVLKDGGFVAFEIGYDQRQMITALAERHSCDITVIKDYSGNDRVAVLKRKPCG